MVDTCINTRDTSGGVKCAVQLASGSTCLDYLRWGDCDKECSLCPCTTGIGTSAEHCSGHGTCEASCTATSCSDVKCKCEPDWTGMKCEGN